MFDFFEFLKGRLSLLVIAFGCLMLFGATIEVNDLRTLQMTPRADPGYSALAAGGGLVLLGIILMLYGDKISIAPSLRGEWIYKVRDTGGVYTHTGLCEVKQKGNKLWIHGQRLLMCKGDGSSCIEAKVQIPWATDWALICDNSNIRFEYHINLPNAEIVKAICRIDLPKNKKTEKISGHYYMLPPFSTEAVNTSYGCIEMWRATEIEKNKLFKARN